MAFWLLRSRELWDQERCLKRIEFFFLPVYGLCVLRGIFIAVYQKNSMNKSYPNNAQVSLMREFGYGHCGRDFSGMPV